MLRSRATLLPSAKKTPGRDSSQHNKHSSIGEIHSEDQKVERSGQEISLLCARDRGYEVRFRVWYEDFDVEDYKILAFAQK